MHLRKLVLACGFASFALSNYASALGLGEVKLKSTLNQPLSAEVQLLDTKGLSPEQIIVALASSGDFERNGLDFVHFYTEFKFEVALDNPGGPIVRITSRNPVREPYLNFLIEAKWTSGRLLREYTLLMDLPTFDDAAPQAVQAAAATAPSAASANDAAVAAEVQAAVDAANASAAADATTDATMAAAAKTEAKPDIIAEQDQPAKKSKAAAGTYGPVGGKDTLWDIALAVRPDSSASVHQTMLALQRLNPNAFIRGNINLLKKGQVLRVPDAAEIGTVSRSEAVSQFNAQTAEWSGASANTSGMGAQLDASNRSSSERVKSEAVAGRVKLEAPTAKDAAASGQASGANKGSGKALESELAATLEELDKAKSDKTELSSRVRDLEAQVKTMQRLVDVSNEKLRALQVNSAKQPDKTVPAAAAKELAVASSVPAASQAAASVAAAAPVASSAAAVAAAPKKPIAKPAPKVVVPEKTLVDQLLDNILWVGLGAAGLVGAAGVVFMRRRKEQSLATFNKENEEFFTPEPNFDAFNQADDFQEESAAEEMALFDEEDVTAVAETGDVVGEADIYIAYGKYDQAEEMLLNGLSKDPASNDIRLKLLEVYSQTQNASEFDKHYAAILPLVAGLALARAKELRANIPGMAEFAPEISPALASAQVQEEEALAFDLDDADLLLEDVDLDVPKDANYGMSFTDKVGSPDASAASLDDDFVLDFDLDEESKSAKAGDEEFNEISLALDGLDDDGLPDDVELPAGDDEFSFDFNDLDSDSNRLAQKVDSITAAEFNEDDALTDDFNLDMDVDNLDLAALDTEMASFDADLDALDDNVISASKPIFEQTESLGESESFSVDALNKTDILDDDLAELNTALHTEHFAEAALEDEKLEDLDLSWEVADDLALEPEPATLASEGFSLDDEDDFDIDTSDLIANTSLQDLDAALADEDGAAALADELDFGSDELSLEMDEQGFAELDLELDDVVLDEVHAVLDENDSSAELDNDLLGLDSEADIELPLDDATVEDFGALSYAGDDGASFDTLDTAEPVAEELALDAPEDDAVDGDIFAQALSDFSAESLVLDEASNISDDMDADLDFMADADEAATKLDLARAYIDMGDSEGARDILAEVAHEGNEQQRQEAVELLGRIDA